MGSLGLLKDMLIVIYRHASDLPQSTRQDFLDFATQLQMKDGELKKENKIDKKILKEETNNLSAITNSNHNATNILLPKATKCVLLSDVQASIKTSNLNLAQNIESSDEKFQNESNENSNDLDGINTRETKKVKRKRKGDSCSTSFEKVRKIKTKKIKKCKTNASSCDQCGEEMPRRNLFNHKLFKHGEKKFFCDQCDSKFFTKGNLDIHAENHSLTTVTCTICESPQFTSTGLKRHMKRRHEEKTLLCSQCSFQANDKWILKDHIQQLHTPQEDWPKCDECDYKHWDKHRVRRHFGKAHQNIRVNCQICTAIFTTTGNMHAHMKKTHKDMLVETGLQNPQLSFKLRYIVPLKAEELSLNRDDL